MVKDNTQTKINGWKIVAIIFIVLFVLETIGVIWLLQIGTKEIDNRTKCSNEICSDSSYDSFSYANGICQCYSSGKVSKIFNMNS